MSRKLPSWTREFETLIRAIGESKSKAEEDGIIYREVELLKPRLKDAKLDKRLLKETLIRLMYVEMLGHDASWGHVKALQACSEQNLLTKKVAYLASSLFLDSSSNLIVLVVNTMLQDLRSENYLTVCTALTAACKLIGADLVNALLPTVLDLLNHPKELVRKKAVMVLHQFLKLDPDQTGPLHDMNLGRHFKTALCDKDPSVMAASLCAIQEAASRDPQAYKALIPSFASILKQVMEKRLPKAFDSHNVSAPFIQIKLIKLMGLVGAGDRQASENMYTVILDAMTRPIASHTIGNAIIIECIRTITVIYPQPNLLQAAAEQIAILLKSSNYNLKYMGIEALSRVVRINASYAHEHQLAVIDCLEDPDETLKGKTLELLFKMTNPNNAEVIVDKMLEYLRATTDEVRKAEAVKSIADLAEKFAPDSQWYIETMNQIFEIGGDVVEPALADNLIRLIADGSGDDDEIANTEMRSQAVTSYLALLEKTQLADILLQVICWVLGEYGTTSGLSAGEIMDRLSAILDTQNVSDLVRGSMLSAFSKLVAHNGASLSAAAREIQEAALSSSNPDIQQRALELESIVSLPQEVQRSILPADAASEEIDIDPDLGFLSSYVQTALQNGAAPYMSEEIRFEMGAVRPSHNDVAIDQSTAHGLRFTAYERQNAPEPVTVRTISRDNSPVRETGMMDSSDAGQSRAASSEPQLALPTGSQQRWGPACFTAPSQTVSPSPIASARSSGAAVGQRQESSSSRSSRPPEPEAVPSGKARLAGLLFGNNSAPQSQRSARGKQSQKPAPTSGRAQAAKPQAPENLLMDFDEPAPPSQSPSLSQNTGDPFAMLEGLDQPSPASGAAKVTTAKPSGALDLDALYGLGGPPSQPISPPFSSPPATQQSGSTSQQDPFGFGSLAAPAASQGPGSGGQGLGLGGQMDSDPFGLGGLSSSVQPVSRNGTGFTASTPVDPFSSGLMGNQTQPISKAGSQRLGSMQKGAHSGPMAARGTAAVEKPKKDKDPFSDLFG